MMFFVSSCATSYQPRGFWSGGYKEAQLAHNIFQVTFDGNGFTSKEKARDYSLLRVAELMKANNYNYFIVISNIDDTTHSSIYTGTYLNTGKKTGVMVGQASDTGEPSNNTTAVGYKSKAEIQGGQQPYETDLVIQSIRAKYNISNK